MLQDTAAVQPVVAEAQCPVLTTPWFGFPPIGDEAVVGLVALVIATAGYFHTVRSYRDRNALECQRRFLADEHLNKHIDRILDGERAMKQGKEASWAVVGTRSIGECELAHSMSEWLNALEEMAVGIRKRVLSEEILYETLKTTAVKTWVLAYPFIQARQKLRPSIYENFVWLGVRWMARQDRASAPKKAKLLKDAERALERVLKAS